MSANNPKFATRDCQIVDLRTVKQTIAIPCAEPRRRHNDKCTPSIIICVVGSDLHGDPIEVYLPMPTEDAMLFVCQLIKASEQAEQDYKDESWKRN